MRKHTLYLLGLLLLACSLGGCGTQARRSALPPAYFTDADFREFAAYANECSLRPELQSHPESNGYALLVGIDSDKFSTPLARPVAETGRLKAKLEECGYAVKLLTNQDATRRNILAWLRFFAEISRKPDLFLFFYSGHGFTPAEKRDLLSPELADQYFPAEAVPSSRAAWQEDFHLMCYQNMPFFNAAGEPLISAAVGNYEILNIIYTAAFSVRAVIIDACTASRISITLPAPPPVNYYSLQRQGFFFCCMLKDKVLDGEFMSIVEPGLAQEADTLTGNRDGLVTVFELINYANSKRRPVLRLAGLQDNDLKYIVYCSEDLPLTIVRQK